MCRFFIVIYVGLLVCGSDKSACAFQQRRTLSSLREVHDRLRKNDTNEYRIDLTANVNYWDRGWKSLFVQDGDTAIFVEMSQQDDSGIPDLDLGDVLHITGTFRPEHYVLRATTVEKVSTGEPAPVLDFPMAKASLGEDWSKRVRVQGVVETVLVRSSQLQLIVRAEARRFVVRRQSNAGELVPPAGSRIELSGTLSCLVDEENEPYAFLVHQMSEDDMTVLDLPDQTAASEFVSDYSELSGAAADAAERDSSDSQIYEIHGQVSYLQEYDFVVIENKVGQSLRVYAPFEGDLHVGDMVWIVGTRTSAVPPDSDGRHLLWAGHDSLGAGTDLISQKVLVGTTAAVPPPPSFTVEDVYEAQVDRVRAELKGPFLRSQRIGDDWEVLIGDLVRSVRCLVSAEILDTGKLNLERALEIQAVGLLLAPETEGGPYTMRVREISDIRVTREVVGIDYKVAGAVLAGLLLLILVSVTLLKIQASRKERALLRLASRLESSYQFISEGLLIIDQKGVVVRSNSKFYELLGLEDSELNQVSGSMEAIGRVLASRFQGDDFLDFWNRANELPRIIEQREFPTVDSEPRTLIANKTLIQDTYGEVDARVWTFNDVTSQKRLEANLLQGQKMEAMGRMVGGVVHDFNNFLTPILGNLELLRLHPQRRIGEVTEYLDGVEKAVECATELVANLMSFSRKSELMVSAKNVHDVIRQMCSLLQRSLSAEYLLEVELAAGCAECLLDENQVIQVLLNVCLNARDAMAPEGGAIRVSTANVCGRELATATGLTPLGDGQQDGRDAHQFLRVRVRDEGKGIPLDLQTQIFEPFFTTKPNDEGTGLGLATSRGIIEQHGGHIVCHSKPNEGACFDIFLPTIGVPATV